MNEVAAYFGWLGKNNIGDEAIYMANDEMFPDIELVDGNAYDQSWINIYGGGTILPRRPTYHSPNDITAAVGVGVEDPHFRNQPFAPIDLEYYLRKVNMDSVLKNTYMRHVIKRIASQSDAIITDQKYLSDDRFEPVREFDYIGVRGPRSKQILDSYGISSKVIGDPALLLEPSTSNHKPTDKIAVTLRSPEGVLKWSNDTEYINTVREFCKAYSDEFEFVFLPFRPIDIKLHVELAKEIPNAVFRDYCSHVDVNAALNEIADSDAMIGERLHSSILAACCLTPFVSLGYQPKNTDFVESINMEEYHIRFDKLTYSWLDERIEAITSSNYPHSRLDNEVNKRRKNIRSFGEVVRSAVSTKAH